MPIIAEKNTYRIVQALRELWLRLVTTDLIADGAVTTAKLSDGAVTNPKLSDMPEGTIKGRAAGAGTGAPQDLTPAQLRAIGGYRETLLADRTYYVATTGSDGNDGLSPGSPFLTLQRAIDVIVGTLDLGGFVATVQLADGTYSAGGLVSSAPIGGSIRIIGNVSTPANVVVQGVTALELNAPTNVIVESFELAGSFRSLMSGHPGGKVIIGAGMRFAGAPSNALLEAEQGGAIEAVGNFAILSNAFRWLAVSGGTFSANNLTITVSGTPAWAGEGIFFDRLGVASLFNVTFSGAATGKRYTGTTNAVLNSFGAGTAATYFPGNVNGTVATGAQQT
jgi:hypothetical protein